MRTRRQFFRSVAAVGALGAVSLPLSQSFAEASSSFSIVRNDRSYWLSILERLSGRILENLASGELKKHMPVEARNPNSRAPFTHLEAFGRLLAGIAPWLELRGLEGKELKCQNRWIELAHRALNNATNPKSADFLNFNDGGQALVDSAFLSQAMLRAPQVLRESLDSQVRKQLCNALKSSRIITTPTDSNWVMFAAMVEAALLELGEPTIKERLESSVERMLSWYKGDGVYGDGEFFHFDYYNSFVIHPMLVDVLSVLRRRDERFASAYAVELNRARRFAEIQERLIAPDGTFPSIGRSTTYRFGAFHALAQIALLRELPEQVKPAQVRCALTAVMRRMIEAPGTFDKEGWLQIGFCGHQPSLAEKYISTGSLYLCSVALLPLGLPSSDPFWKDAPVRWTSQRLWSGESLLPDHALAEKNIDDLPNLNRSDK